MNLSHRIPAGAAWRLWVLAPETGEAPPRPVAVYLIRDPRRLRCAVHAAQLNRSGFPDAEIPFPKSEIFYSRR